MRPARGPGKEDSLNVMGALGLDNAFSFMQGCVSQRPAGIGDPDTLLVGGFMHKKSIYTYTNVLCICDGLMPAHTYMSVHVCVFNICLYLCIHVCVFGSR